MDTILLEIIKYMIPALVVFFTSFILLNSYLNNDFKKRLLEFRQSNQKITLPLRLQSYERMTLFLERISPNNLIHRTYKTNMSVRDFHLALISSIRLEYEHNQAQQIYVSPQTWELVVSVKEEIINIMNIEAAKLPPTAPGKKLTKAILETLIQSEQILPTQRALNALKKEVKQLY